MATNPMKKKARTSFILGVLITFLIMAIVVAFLLYSMLNMKKAEEERQASLVITYALKTDVKSGDTIDASKLATVTTDKLAAPANAVKASALTENTIAKIDLTKGTIITDSMITDSDSPLTNDLRVQEYNMIKISSQIASEDYIDIRLRMPSGLDYIVISKKKIEIPQIEGVDSLNTIWMKLTEDETVSLSNAIVEAYKMKGAMLYTAKYVEPGTQEKATPTYVPSTETINLITQNPNVVQEAKTAMYNRYQTYRSIRDSINSEVSNVDEDDAKTGVESGVAKDISTTTEQRKSYLDSLAGN